MPQAEYVEKAGEVVVVDFPFDWQWQQHFFLDAK
jgi:hypothetical protein